MPAKAHEHRIARYRQERLDQSGMGARLPELGAQVKGVLLGVSRLLAIDADLSAPPSSATCWRDVSLYASIRLYDVVAVASPDMRSLYWHWMRQHGLLDYVEDILTPRELKRERVLIQIEGGPKARLTTANLHAVLSLL